MMRDVGIDVRPSVQEWEPRRESVSVMLTKHERGMPSLLIDPSCNRLIQGFSGGYGYKEVQMGVFSDKPVKNRFSHIHDALQYVLVKLVAYNTRARRLPRKKPKMARQFAGYGG